MLTEKDYCDYETCFALEEVGFPLHPYGNTEIDKSLRLTLLLYEAQKWLREEKKIDVGATWDNDEDNWYVYIKKIGFPDWSGTSVSHSCYSSYEEALSEGIKEAVKILKEKNINQRKALEAENTEFDYGHNVKHCSED